MFKIGQITNVEKHPNADALVVTQVNIGEETIQVITNDVNIQTGSKVVVALPGATVKFPDGQDITIKKSKIRGVESVGMFCGQESLGMPVTQPGVFICDEDIEVGVEFKMN